MKTIEEVKEHFKDAKIVESVGGMCRETTLSGEYYYNKNHSLWYDSLIGNAVWCPIKGFAKIIEYKTKPNQINIDIPKGYEVDKDNSTFECIKFKKIEKQLPNSWDECYKHLDEKYGFGFDYAIVNPRKEYKALRKLELLRDCYNDGWVADWNDNTEGKEVIFIKQGEPITNWCCMNQVFLNFKTAELRDKFLENFKDIIEIAKPLL